MRGGDHPYPCVQPEVWNVTEENFLKDIFL